MDRVLDPVYIKKVRKIDEFCRFYSPCEAVFDVLSDVWCSGIHSRVSMLKCPYGAVTRSEVVFGVYWYRDAKKTMGCIKLQPGIPVLVIYLLFGLNSPILRKEHVTLAVIAFHHDVRVY